MAGAIEDKLRMLRRSIRAGEMSAASELLQQTARDAAPAPVARDHTGPQPLAKVCEGVETQAGRGGRFWLIRRTLAEFSPRLAGLPKRYAAIIGGARQRWDELSASAALCKAADGRPEDLLFMDIESCGLIPAPVFLIGMMQYVEGDPRGEGGHFLFEQYLARDYSEESAILRAFAEKLPLAPILVTFNGKSFDMNLLRQRGAFHGVELPTRLAFHLDLLHESRKRWRTSLPNCRLQTLEQYLCGRRRVGDIPGAMIAEAYHSFVRSGDARPIGTILHHNLLDLLTMGELVCHLLTGTAPPE